MVVLVIMGVLTGFAVLGLGSPGGTDRLQQESKRLQAKIRLAGEDAVLEGRDFGIGFTLNGYMFYQLDEEEKWQAITADPYLKETELEEDLELQLVLEDVEIVMSKKQPEKPQVFVLSSGESTPFEVEFKSKDFEEREAVAVAFDMLGRVKKDDEP